MYVYREISLQISRHHRVSNPCHCLFCLVAVKTDLITGGLQTGGVKQKCPCLPSLTSSPALSSSSSSLARWSSSPRLPGSTTWRRGPSPRRMNKGPSPHRHQVAPSCDRRRLPEGHHTTKLGGSAVKGERES